MRAGAIAAALAAVAVGAITAYGWSTSGTQVQAIGLGIMLAGTVGLAGVLVRTLFGLRRPRRTQRPGPVTPLGPVPEQIRRSHHVATPPATALRSSSAASRRFAGYGAAD